LKTKKTWKVFKVRVIKTNFSDKINSPVSSRAMAAVRVMMQMNCSEKRFHRFYIYNISKKFLQAARGKFYAKISFLSYEKIFVRK